MNFYKHFMGDYQRDTMRLSMAEDGAYRRLLDEYYATETPLPDDREECYRAARAITAAERAAVDKVLDRYFPVNGDGLRHNKKADELIAAAKEQAETNRRTAEAREARRKEHEHGTNRSTNRETGDSTKQQPIQSHSQSQIQNHDPDPSDPDADASGGGRVPPCPHEAIIAMYHEMLPTCPRVKVWTGKRQGHLRQRWREYPSLDEWREFFRRVAQSKFLTGGTAAGKGRSKPFVADLAWLVNPENFAKVLEGKYAG